MPFCIENVQYYVTFPLLQLQLFFSDKWILISEVDFLTTSPPNKTQPDNIIQPKSDTKTVPDIASKEQEGKASKPSLTSKEDLKLPQDQSSLPAKSSSSSSSESSSSVNQSSVYVGLVIGVLGVTVLLLLATIAVMVGRNRAGKVFNKPLFNSPPERHETRHAANYYGDKAVYEEAAMLDNLESGASAIYQEPFGPYRVVLQRSNNSCGRLCDYDEPHNVTTSMSMARLPQAKNKFGSTPHFSAQQQQHFMMTQQPQQQQQQHHFAPHQSSFSSYEVAATATGGRLSNNNSHYAGNSNRRRLSNENFYAATDIFRQQHQVIIFFILVFNASYYFAFYIMIRHPPPRLRLTITCCFLWPWTPRIPPLFLMRLVVAAVMPT